jgi:5-methylcytosine-specific restriction protein B
MATADSGAALHALASLISSGLPAPERGARPLLEALFGGRYHKRYFEPTAVRDAYALATGDGSEGVPYAGLIHPDNPPSGPYGGTSVVWFPTKENGSLIGFVVGTRGLSPDEGILTRPGHRRRIAALRRYLSRIGVDACWTKPDPSALGVQIPTVVRERFSEFDNAFRRYEREMYCIAKVPRETEPARKVVQAFFDLYAYERNWKVLKECEKDYYGFLDELRQDLFHAVTPEAVNELLRQRRFVVLQGPPGTGKTRMTEEVGDRFFAGRAMTIQFHPAVTYEDFVVGLSPDPKEGTLRFDVRRGWLLEAARAARETPFLLVIDEINRADLGKVLGEAIYLFEAEEVGGPHAREVELPHAVDGERRFSIPENLYVLATMNTADRSIAAMDLAVRRRFAFVTIPPQRSVVADQALPLAVDIFDRLTDVFVEHAPDDALDLLPGHAYFLARSEAELLKRFHYELLPLLDEYLRQGLLGPAGNELHAVRDIVEDIVSTRG